MLKFLETHSNTLSENTFKDKFFGKKILVMGSGPSVTQRKWQNVDVDGVCTTSFFYLNSEVSSLKNILHITLSDIVDLKHEKLLHFLDSNLDCTIAFEPKNHPFYTSENFLWFFEKYKNRIVYYNTAYGMKEGVAGRLCYFVMSFAPSELYYVGIDGKSKNELNDPPNAFRVNIRDADGYPQEDFVKSHDYFAKNIFEQSKLTSTKLFNIGEGLPYNLSTQFSKKHYPLPDKLREII